MLGTRMLPLVAAVNGTVTSLRDDSSGSTGNMITITDDDGWSVIYMHVNNDTPGTDDNANRREHAFAPGIAAGVRVTAGQTIAYMGDSGNAEGSTAHLHFEMSGPNGSAFNPYTSLRLAQAWQLATGLCVAPSNPTAEPNAAANRGYWAVDAAGAVFAFGAAPYLGGLNRGPGHTPSSRSRPLRRERATGSSTQWARSPPSATRSTIGSLAEGAPERRPSSASRRPAPALATGSSRTTAASSPSATRHSTAPPAAMTLNAPIIAMASTPTGDGYWLLGADGGIFNFGDAAFHGSAGTMNLAAPVVGIAPTSTSDGYWLLGRDGGVFSFGDAAFTGSIPGTGLCQPPAASAMIGSETGRGLLGAHDRRPRAAVRRRRAPRRSRNGGRGRDRTGGVTRAVASRPHAGLRG